MCSEPTDNNLYHRYFESNNNCNKSHVQHTRFKHDFSHIVKLDLSHKSITNNKFVKTTTHIIESIYCYPSRILSRWIDNDNNISPRKNVDIAVSEKKKLQCNPFSESDTMTMRMRIKLLSAKL